MFTRSLPLLLAIVCLTAFMNQSAFGHDKAEGAFVQVKEGKLTLTAKGSDKRNTFEIAKDATVSLDGKSAKIEDLKEGFPIVVMLGEKHVVTKIEALSKAK